VSAWSRVARPERVPAPVVEFIRYGLCSGLALGVDMGLLLLLTRGLGLHYLLSAALGFSAGLFVAYALSVRYAFRDRRLEDARAEFIGFAAVGVLGLGLTQLLLKLLVGGLGLDVAAAKIVTAGFVFLFNFGVRKAMLFSRTAP
jgi:putative flippase GtrA